MKFKTGQEIKFKSDTDLLLWVDGILPAGQCGIKETNYKISINGINFDLPVSKAEQIFEDALVVKKPKPVPKKTKAKKNA